MNLNVIDSGSGTPVVWIHGFPLSSSVYQPQMSIAGMRHIVPDLPGFGRSPAAESDMTMETYAQAVLHELDARGIEQAWFAGVSMGGYVCLALARIAPERMRGLILIDTRETADDAQGKKGRYDSIAKVRHGGIAPVVESMLPKMLSASASKELVAEVREIMESSSDKGVISALRAMAERPDSSALLPKLNVPVLVIVGDEDVITPPSDAQRMAAAIPNAKLVIIKAAGHLSQMEKPEEFNQAVKAFVR